MANEEHIAVLKQGVKAWNGWRSAYPETLPDLSGYDLKNLDVAGVNFTNAKLVAVDCHSCDLSQSTLAGANLTLANLGSTVLEHCNMRGARLTFADLNNANLRNCILYEARLEEAILVQADLCGADLRSASIISTDFTDAIIGSTSFGGQALSQVIGLESIKHTGESFIGLDILHLTQGRLLSGFLHAAGMDPDFVEHVQKYFHKEVVVSYYSCFISYFSHDRDFVAKLNNDLRQANVRCWFAPEDMKIGDEIHAAIDEAIRIHDKLLLVLSKQSVNSRWVQREVEKAFEEERQDGKLVLFPLRLDDAVLETNEAWAADIRRQKHIGNFTQWKDQVAYQRTFERLLRDLKAEE